MMKKLFAMLLMVALCVGLVTVANAADSGSFVDSNNRQGYWALDDAGVLTISGNANIPSQSTAPYTVYRPNIKFIIIKDGVQTINTDAFSEYNALRSIIIPDSVNTIYHGIFNYCYNLVSVVYHGTEEPQKVASDFYRNAFDGLTIYVPTGYPYKDGFLEKLVNIKVSDTTPNVSFSANGGTGTMESIKTLSGATIVLPSCKFTAPNNNFKAWSVNGVEYQPGALLTVEKDTTIKAVWAKPIYSISINQPSVDGKVTVAKSNAQAGETIQMTVKMDNTDKVPVFDVRDANGNAITVTDDYTFTMPASNVTIDVEFEYCTHKKFKEQSDGTVKCVACGDLAYFKVTTKNQVVTYHTNLNNKNTGALEIVERNPGCTLTVLADYDWTIQINSDYDFILDLGGHTVTASSFYALDVGRNGAKVLVKNGTLTCTGSFHYGVVGVTMSSATLTLDGVIVKNNASKDSIPCITNVGALKIVGGTQLTGNNQVISVQNEQALTDLSNATNPSGWTVANGILDIAIPVTTDSNVASGIILGEDYVMRVEDDLVNEVKSRESGIIEHKHVAAQPYTDNGNGTHNATCECGAVVTEDCVFTNSYPVGLKCICGALGKELVVTGGTEGTDYTYVNGVVTILTETPITIKNAGNVETSRHRIVINPGEGKSANVTFAGLFLDPEVYYPTVAISSGTAKISPLGTNELHPPKVEANAYGASNATIHVPGNTSLILEGTGTLNVFGQGKAAAIGASSMASGAAGQCGQITINNGTYNVVQNFNQGGAGIGGASNRDSFGSGSMGGITINGGTVNVVGKSWGGAAIGGGYNANGGKIIINGGTVTTEAAAIGGGYDERYGKQNTNATVSITGGTVNAEYISAKTTMEAGKMNLGRAEELIMKGGTIESIGGIARLYMYDGIMNINVSELFYGMEQAGIGGGGTYRNYCKFEMHGGKVTVNAAYVGIGGYYDSDKGNASGTIKFCGGELIVENTNTTVDRYAGIGSDRKNHSITMDIAPAKNTMITVRAGKTLNSLETLATVSAGEPLTYDSSNLTVERKAWHLTTTEVVDPDYTVSITTPNNGTVTADVATAKAGETVTLTVTPNVGYVVDYVKYNDTTITPVTGVYSFTMPAENVAVTAIFKVCDHEGSTHTTFDNTGEKHSYICTLCAATVTEDHTFDTDTCVCGAKAVADVDGSKFANLDDALSACRTDSTLTLLEDITRSESVSLNKVITFDLGGKTLTFTGSATLSFSNDGTLQNGTMEGAVSASTALTVYNANVLFKDFELHGQYNYGVGVSGDSTLTLENCKISAPTSSVMMHDGKLVIKANVYLKEKWGIRLAETTGNIDLQYANQPQYSVHFNNQETNCAGFDLNNPLYEMVHEDGTLVSAKNPIVYFENIIIRLKHVHDWTFTAEGETISAVCSADDCPQSQQSMTLVAPENLVYDGTAKTVTIDGSIEDVQMPSISYTGDTTNVTEEGCMATITVAGETATLSFKIVPASIAEATVSAEDQTYTGDAITPEVIVSLDSKNLMNNDYAVVYEGNVNVGTATITVTGKGNYTGTATGEFNIEAASIEAAQITVANQIYTGKAITPDIATVKLGEKTLVKDTDYTVEYTDNINVGEATVTVNGMGNYAGTVEAKFQISKSDADVAAKSYLGETEQSAFFYGDVITVKGSAAVTQTFALRAPNDKAQLYYDDILLAEGDVSGNSFTLSYDTTEKKLPVDTHTLTVEFGGNGNLNGKAVTVTVTLNKAAPDVTAPTGLSATYGQTLADITLPTVDNGVWSWKEDTTTQVGNTGEQTYVLVFTPNDSSFVNVIEVNADITVSPLELKGVTAPSDVELTAYHATAEEVKNQLPATITVTGADNKNYKLPVTWTWDSFNDQPNSESNFTWTADLGSNFTATDVATTGTITVTNGSALSVTITGTNQETTYNGNSYNVSGMFTIDPNAGAATYAIVEGGTGAGTLEGSVLTITKAGTITIKVSTAQKLPYAAGEASATLTVNKGELSVEPLTNLTAVYGDTLSAVELPENWAWKTPETKVGDVGDRVHIAVYNTDPNLWNDKEVSLSIKVNKASIQLDASVKTFLGEVEQTTFTYGDVITVKVTPVMPMLLSAELVAPAPNQMALFYGSQQISSPVDAVNGTYTMEYATTDKVLPTGESKLTVRYVGNGNTNDASSDLPVMINPKTVTLSAVKAVSRAYDPSSLTVGIESATLEGVLNNDDVAVDTLALQATINKADAGTYTEVLLPEPIKLIGTAAQYYKATGGRIAADVTITKVALTPAGTPNLGDVMPGTPLGDVPTGPIEELFKPVEGTVTWKDPAETPVEPGKEYEWTFTPVDPNYDSVTDSVVIIPNTSFLVTVVNGTGSGEYEAGATVTITANAPAAGKQFTGWTSDDVTFVNANAITTSFTMPAKAVTVTANYIDVSVPEHYTVAYNANGGTGTMANQYFSYGETKALLTNVFTREGYTFKGWNTKADGTGTAYVDGQVVTMYNAAILYAQWKSVEAPEVTPLEIIQQPTDQMVAPGEKAQFSIVANGDGVTYQWYINRNDGRGWVKLQGATNAVHEISAADLAYDGFQYACEVRDIHGNVVRSQVAVLYVAAIPEIPETGDATNLPMLSAMLLLSFAGCLLLVNRKRMAN